MEAWQEKRSIQTMNLRSVFNAEQQRVLERYYDNGMTNQSKSCFQLILQCAQETKLDFSVVRTWVGNKRRKLASKADQNGVEAHNLPNHSLAGGGGVLVAGSVLTAEMAAARSVQRGLSVAHLLPPASCPSSSSSPSSCGSSGSANNNNNDVIVTGTYSLARNAARLNPPSNNRTAMKALPLHAEAELALHARPALHTDSSSLHANVATLSRVAPQLATSSPLMYSQIRKPFSPREPPGIPRSWAKQYGTAQHPSWPLPTQSQPLPLPTTPAVHRSPPPSTPEASVRIQQVFTLAGLGDVPHRPVPGTSQERGQRKTRPTEPSESFSIAMETGDADDEYSREEELANMGAQIQISSSSADGSGGSVPAWVDSRGMSTVTGRNQSTAALNPSNSDLFGHKGCQTSSSFLPGTTSRGSYPFRLFPGSSPPRMPNFKVTGNVSAPWLTSNSRKRTLQDRTQFSDRDLYTMKRYWDIGMTSLGSVCREKISAAATELSVDTEIVKTWIGNRRRKYRLMGIEIPPPKGGPAIFPPKQANAESLSPLTPEGEEPKTPEPGEDTEQNDMMSICLSEDGTSDTYQIEADDVNEETNSAALADNVKIEIIDEDDDDYDDGGRDVMTSDIEHMHNLLEFKHEEVQFLESELENQKQKYYELKSFTKSLLSAVKNNDMEKQQELLASLPQQVEEDWERSPEREPDPSAEMISNQNDSSVSEEVGDTGPL